MQDQRAEYDEARDRLYVQLLDESVDNTVALDDRRSVDYAADGRIVGVQFAKPFAGGINLSGIPLARVVGALILQSGHKFRMVE
ncbi:MAG: DUF2283 domain-containing protein [Dehalococcoidia bacterium]|nr:DUF2283 domain-containing protein [Dehalococcoidia bacterium]